MVVLVVVACWLPVFSWAEVNAGQTNLASSGKKTESAVSGKPSLWNTFTNPPDEARPWTFWYWMHGAVSKAGIAADLEAMKEIGLGGAYLMTIRGTEGADYPGAVDQLSPAWWEMIRYAMQKADSLKLQLGMHISDGFALAGGPWIKPEESMQKLVWTDTIVEGGKTLKLRLLKSETTDGAIALHEVDRKDVVLRQPETLAGYYRDVAVYAIPVGDYRTVATSTNNQQFSGRTPAYRDIALARPLISSDNPDDPAPFYLTGRAFRASENPENPTPFTHTGRAFRASEPCYIQFEYPENQLLQSLEILPSGNNLQSQRLRLLVSKDGKLFREHYQLEPPRQGWQNTGFNYTYSIPPVEARFFRFHWTPEGTEPGSEELDAAKWRPRLSISGIKLSSQPRIAHWEAKSGLVWRKELNGEKFENKAIPGIGSVQRIALMNEWAEIESKNEGMLPKHAKKVDSHTITLPPGQWRILRFGHTSTGHTNATGGAGRGLECDKFSEPAVQKQFDNWFAAAFRATDPELARRVLTHMHIDSWECGSQNWSRNFAQEFQRRRGYDLMPWLPVMAGFPLESRQQSEKVLLDVRTTINDLVQEVFFNTFSKNARAYNCRFSAECVAPTMMSDGMQHFQYVDLPMGEFWLNSPTHDKPNDMLDAISGARIYGKNIIQGEGFTQLRTTWNEHPAQLKPLLERNFAMGLNKLFFHVFVHNPHTDKAPGTTLDGIGLYFQRDQTWWMQGKAFVDYITRTQALLQTGHPVVDIAVFTGEEMPRRALTPDKLTDDLPGLIGEKKLREEAVRKANAGQPIRELPAGVFHSAHIFEPAEWVNPLNGYSYDSFNKDALLRLARADNGKLKFPGGSEYRVVIFPEEHSYSEKLKQKIKELRIEGVNIPTLPVVKPGNIAFAASEKTNTAVATVEKTDINQVYSSAQSFPAPDLIAPEAIAWTHRRDGDTDIYFVSNQQNTQRELSISVRMDSRTKALESNTKENEAPLVTVPQVWDPVRGTKMHFEWKPEGERTQIRLTLAEYGSAFIVFLPEIEETAPPKPVATATIMLDKNPWELTFRRNKLRITTNNLFDWSSHTDSRIRYYSGTVVYRTQFEWDGTTAGAMLDIRELYNLATVRINGTDCGTIWTKPYTTDISNALKKGTNMLELEVTNTWANAILGSDIGLPPYEGISTNGKYRKKEQETEPAGVKGVSIIFTRSSPMSLSTLPPPAYR
jgi:hypothetical protein